MEHLDHRNLIQFVRGNAQAKTHTQAEDKSGQEDDHQGPTGEEVKAFYESLISDTPDTAVNTCKRQKHGKRSSEDRIVGASLKKRRCSQRQSETNTHSDSNLVKTNQASFDLSGENQRCSNKWNESNEVEILTKRIKKEVDWDSDTHSYRKTNDQNFQRKESKIKCDVDEHHMHPVTDKNHNKMLAYCQNGEIKNLNKLLKTSPSLDIDYQDQYGWTALMCATVANNLAAVEYLLKKGANKYVQNDQGQTAADLADSKGAFYIRDQIYLYCNKSDDVQFIKNEKFYCEICKAEFEESTVKEHSTSTVHLFNMKLKPKPDSFMIPETNVGYRLMKHSGWDGEKGLGPDGEGQRFPVKTSLKRDRSCLGSKQNASEKKITHFGPNDTDALKPVCRHSQRIVSARVASKRERKRREKRDKQWERNLRQYMNTD